MNINEMGNSKNITILAIVAFLKAHGMLGSSQVNAFTENLQSPPELMLQFIKSSPKLPSQMPFLLQFSVITIV